MNKRALNAGKRLAAAGDQLNAVLRGPAAMLEALSRAEAETQAAKLETARLLVWVCEMPDIDAVITDREVREGEHLLVMYHSAWPPAQKKWYVKTEHVPLFETVRKASPNDPEVE